MSLEGIVATVLTVGCLAMCVIVIGVIATSGPIRDDDEEDY